MSNVNSLAVVLTNDLHGPDSIALSVALHRHGFEAAAKTLADGSVAFDLGSGAELAVANTATPHPDAVTMPRGVTTPPAEELAAARSHLVVAALHLDRLVGDEPEAIDLAMMQITAAVVSCTDAIAAMLGHGVYFHEAHLFTTLTVIFSEQGRVPPRLAINVTTGQLPNGRLTVLTHGLARYGRMEVLCGCTTDVDASAQFAWQLVEWLMENELHRLVPGTLVPGSDGSEQAARGMPSPLGDGSTVVYIELGRPGARPD